MHMQAAASHKESYHRDAKEALGNKYDHDIVERTRETFLKGEAGITYNPLDQYFIGTALEMSKILYQILFTSKKMVLVSKTDEASEFITSDNPVTHYLIEDQKGRPPSVPRRRLCRCRIPDADQPDPLLAAYQRRHEDGDIPVRPKRRKLYKLSHVLLR